MTVREVKGKGRRARGEEKRIGELRKQVKKDQQSSQWALLVVEKLREVMKEGQLLGNGEGEKDLVKLCAQGIEISC